MRHVSTPSKSDGPSRQTGRHINQLFEEVPTDKVHPPLKISEDLNNLDHTGIGKRKTSLHLRDDCVVYLD
jgi:hypothetical protein